jgi:hypothetical protein
MHQFGVLRCDAAMTKTRQQEVSDKFTEQWQRSRDWLVPFMQNNQPKFLTKDELRSGAMRELNVSKSAIRPRMDGRDRGHRPARLVRATTPTAAQQELAYPSI